MEKNKEDLTKYRSGKLTVLQLMAVLAILGIAVFCLGRWLLGS